MLAKNPAGWLEIIHMVADNDHPLVLAFNSDGVDGRDPSWLYDVPVRTSSPTPHHRGRAAGHRPAGPARDGRPDSTSSEDATC